MKQELFNFIADLTGHNLMDDEMNTIISIIYNSKEEREHLLLHTNRVEVVDQKGRRYVNWEPHSKVSLAFQDSGRTLKVFITGEPPLK
jgi:hypothetical protein